MHIWHVSTGTRFWHPPQRPSIRLPALQARSQTGHIHSQPPQLRHSAGVTSKAVATFRDVPRPTNPMPPDCICSPQKRTQRPQRIHPLSFILKRTLLTPMFEAISWRVLEFGQEASNSSIISRRAFCTFSELVRTICSGSAGKVQDASREERFPLTTSTVQIRQAP